MRRKDREVTDINEIKDIVNGCKVCRLGFKDGEGVYIVPMNFGYVFEGEKLTVYFHGAREGKKLDLVKENPAVGIEMDAKHSLVEGKSPCQYSYQYASMIGQGTAQIIEAPEEKQRALALIMKHQTGKDFPEFEENPRLQKAVAIIKVTVEEYACKKYV